MRFTDFMLDLETFGTSPTAPIASLALVAFNRISGETAHFYQAVAPDLTKYQADYSTVAFWLKQAEAPRLALLSHAKPAKEVLQDAAIFYAANADGYASVWALPASFDLVIFENACRVEGVKVPWHYSVPRCLRTIFDAAKIEKSDRVKAIIERDALSDCIAQIATLRLAWKKLDLYP